MLRPGEHAGIIKFLGWMVYILEEKMKYHFFRSVESGSEDLLSVYNFLPQITELIQKHSLADSKLEYYVMHMKRKTVREYALLMQRGYDFHSTPSEQPLIATLSMSHENFTLMIKKLAETFPEI